MTFWTIIFSALGFLNPSKRGSLIMAELLFYVLMGAASGYVTARLYKTFNGTASQRATVVTALAFPGLCFFLFFLMDLMAWSYGSSDAVPFPIMLVLLVLWFGISSPLVFLGAYFGYKQDAIEFPVKTSSIPRQIPDQPWYTSISYTLMIAGMCTFGACFVELYFIMASVWKEFYYYNVFGFLLLVFFIVIITCAEITLLFNYSQLCNEDYHWWWRSFGTAGSMAIYVFLYSIVYFQQLEADGFFTYVLYFGYMGLSSIGLFLMMGFIGVASSLWFNKTIFGGLP
jgi:transmembrane 9 superfamily protein 2/4